MQSNKKTEIWRELLNMKPIKVKLEQVYLDPNNPRIEFPKKEKVPEAFISKDEVQERCLKELHTLGLFDLIGSISTSGFSTVDRVVLRTLQTKKGFVVVEGNRRVATLKILAKSHTEGTKILPEEILTGVLEFEALLYTGKNSEIAWVVQGFRHTPGIQPWKDYPGAKFIATFEKESGKTLEEIASIFGMKKRDVSDSIRWYYGFEQAAHDEEFGDIIKPQKFGLFKEVIFPKPSIRNWLGWDDYKRAFTKKDELKNFLSWVSKDRIDISPRTRRTLAKIMEPENKDLLEKFDEEEISLEECAERLAEKERPRPTIEPDKILENLSDVKIMLSTLPIPLLKREKQDRKKIMRFLEELYDILGDQIRNLKSQR